MVRSIDGKGSVNGELAASQHDNFTRKRTIESDRAINRAILSRLAKRTFPGIVSVSHDDLDRKRSDGEKKSYEPGFLSDTIDR